MELKPEARIFSDEKKEAALTKVKRFCANWETANIVSFSDGTFLIERLDKKGEQVGIYGFDNQGELIDFELGSGGSILEEMMKSLASEGTNVRIIELNKNDKQQVVREKF